MSLSRRVCFTTLANDHPQPADDNRTEHSTDAIRKAPESRPDRTADTVRLALTLFESDEVTYPEFNYSQRVKQQDKGRPAADEEEEEEKEVAATVERLEKKFGTKPKSKDRIQDLIDIGYGYEEDSFIDNSEAYDEFVPASITTKLGGFYINSGLLQFRQASDTDDVTTGEETPEATRKRKLSLGQCKPKKKKVCGEDGELECSVGQRSWGLNESRPHEVKKKKRKKSAAALDVASMLRKFEREKAKRQRQFERVNVEAAADAAGGGTSGMNDPLMSLIGSTNDHALIQAANTVDFDIDLESLLSVGEAASAPKSHPQSGPEARDCARSTSSKAQPDPDPVQLLSKTVSTSQHPCVPPLEGIPAGLNDTIRKLNLAALTIDGESKVKFFSPETNSILLDIELQCREQGSQVRSKVYTHLSSFLPCSRETLLKRVKKIFHSHTEQRPHVEDPVHKLREAVGRAMPEQIASFQEHCLVYKTVKSAGTTVEEREGGSNLHVEQEDKGAQERTGNRGVPKKLFKWNEEVRECLFHVLKEKMELFKSERREGLEQEEYLKTFLDHEVKPIWPKGWMQSRVLMSESRKILSLVTPSLFKKTRFKKKQSSDCSSVLPAPEPLGVDLQDGDDGDAKTEASVSNVDGGFPMSVAADSGSLASLQSDQSFGMNFSTDSSLVLLADQALAQEPPQPASHQLQCKPSGQHWSAAVDITSVALPPSACPASFLPTDTCQVVLPELLEVAGFARHVDAGQAQVIRADANITIQ